MPSIAETFDNGIGIVLRCPPILRVRCAFHCGRMGSPVKPPSGVCLAGLFLQCSVVRNIRGNVIQELRYTLKGWRQFVPVFGGYFEHVATTERYCRFCEIGCTDKPFVISGPQDGQNHCIAGDQDLVIGFGELDTVSSNTHCSHRSTDGSIGPE